MKKMTMKHNEPGRTMVEMLGVLSIVGVLSLTAVAGITYAMRRQAVVQTVDLINKSTRGVLTGKVLNTLGDDPSALSVVSTQPIPLNAYMSNVTLTSAAEKDVHGKETFVGPRGSVFSARPSALQGYGFVLAVNNMQSAVCENVLAHDLDYDAVVRVDDEGQPIGNFVDAIDLDEVQNRKAFCQSEGDEELSIGFVFNKISPDDDGSNQPECNACTKPVLGQCLPKETCGGQNADRKYLDTNICACKCLDANAEFNNDCACPSDKPVWNDVDKKCEACPNGEKWDGISKKCVSSSGRGAVVVTDITTTTATPTTYVPKTTDRSSTVVSTSPVTSTYYTTTGMNTTTTGAMTTETTIPATTTTGSMTTETTIPATTTTGSMTMTTATPTTYVSESTDWSSTEVSTSPVTSIYYTTTGMNTITVETETPTVYEPETTWANTTIAEPETTTPLETCDPGIYDEIYKKTNEICKKYIGKELDDFASCVKSSGVGVTLSDNGQKIYFEHNGISYESGISLEQVICNSDMSSVSPKPLGCSKNLCCSEVKSVASFLATVLMELDGCANKKVSEAAKNEIKNYPAPNWCKKDAWDAYNAWIDKGDMTTEGPVYDGIVDKLDDMSCTSRWSCTNGKPDNCPNLTVTTAVLTTPVLESTVVSTSPVSSTLYTTTGMNTITVETETPTTYVSESTDWSSTEVSTSPVSSTLYTTTGVNTTTGAMTTETTIPGTTTTATATPTTYVPETTYWSSTEVSTSPITSISYTTTTGTMTTETTIPATTTTGAMTTTTVTETDSNVLTTSVGCGPGEFMDGYRNCYPCSIDGRVETTREECAKCDNRTMSAAGYCSLSCKSGEFLYNAGYCASCSESTPLLATAEECAKCDNRIMSANGTCALQCGPGEFMSITGECNSCSTKESIKPTAGECAKCDNRALVGDACSLICPSGEFLDGYGNCYPCNVAGGIDTTQEECDKCEQRYMHSSGQCSLKSCGNGQVLSPSGDCVLPCGSGAFMANNGSCYSCKDTLRVKTTQEECVKCGNRVMSAAGYCAVSCKSGEFMANNGACYPCSSPEGWVLATAEECAKCDNRVMNVAGSCALPCAPGEFMGKNGSCYSCSDSSGRNTTQEECAQCDNRVMSADGYCVVYMTTETTISGTTTTGSMTTTTATATPTTYVSESTDWSSTEVSTSPVTSTLYTTTGMNTTTTSAMTTETTIPATTTTGAMTTTTATPTTYVPETTDWSSTEVLTSSVSSTLYTTTGVDTTITETATSTTYEPETTVLLSTEVSTSPVTSTLYTTTGVDKYFEWEARIPVGHSSIQRFPIDSLDEALSDPDLKDHIYSIGIGGGATPLKVAILNNDLQLMRKCLDAEVDPDKGNMNGTASSESPLAKAVNNYGNLVKGGKDPSVAREQITALLNAGANPNIPVSISLNECGRQTPLHVMAQLRDNSMIGLLVSKGADITAEDCGRIPLDVYKANLTNWNGGALEWRESEDAEIIQMLTPRGWFW